MGCVMLRTNTHASHTAANVPKSCKPSIHAMRAYRPLTRSDRLVCKVPMALALNWYTASMVRVNSSKYWVAGKVSSAALIRFLSAMPSVLSTCDFKASSGSLRVLENSALSAVERPT